MTLALLAGCSAASLSTADAKDRSDPVARYEAALAPLKKRSDVLEDRFARVQGQANAGSAQLRDVLVEIIPEYAELLEETRAIEVEGAELQKAHEALIASLEKQQEGLDLALRGIEQGDPELVRRAGKALQEAQTLVDEHRRLLAAARR